MSEAIARSDRKAFRTRDGSTVRELAHPDNSAATAQSLAEAVVGSGAETIEHLHRRAEEIYHFSAGVGRMRLGGELFDVRAGDSVVIPPGTAHKLWNAGTEDLVLLCCCSPPYSDEDTVITEG